MTKFLRFSTLLVSTVAFVGCASKDASTVPDMPPPNVAPPQQAANYYEPATTSNVVGAGTGSAASTEPLTASGEYTVKPGDSLWKIAHQHNTSVAKITALNGFTDNVIRPGQVIKLP